MRRKFYLPFDEVFDCLTSFGFLLYPTFKRDNYGKTRWMLLTKSRYGVALNTRTSRFRLSDFNGFQNMTVNPPNEIRDKTIKLR